MSDLASQIREVAVTLPDGTVLKTSGHEVVLADILSEVRSDGPLATAASFVGVLVLVSLAFRHLRDRLAVVVSLLVGITWMCGVGALFGLKINMLNFVALPITFGIGTAEAIEELTVDWPSGTKDQLRSVRAGRAYVITEGRGITSEAALAR